MSSEQSEAPRGSPKVQTFAMPTPVERPEAPSSEAPRSNLNAILIAVFLVLLAGVLGFWAFYLKPKNDAIKAERAAAEAAAAVAVRPWYARAEEAMGATFQGSSGDELARVVALALEPGATGPELDGVKVESSETRVTTLFTVSWTGSAGAPASTQLRWVCSEAKHEEVAVVVPEGGAAPSEKQAADLSAIFAQQVFPLLQRSIPER